MFGCCDSKWCGLAVAAGLGIGAGVIGSSAWRSAPAASPGPEASVETVGFAQPEAEMTPEQMMEFMAQWAEPVEQHKLLKDMAGTWDCTTKFWMGPGEPSEGKGVSESEMVLGDRYVTQHFTMDFMGRPFEGMGAIGFDKAKGKYVNVWIDNFSTGVMTMEGEYDAKSKTMTWTGNAVYPGPEGVMEVPVKHIIKHKDKDTMIMEFWEPNPETGEMMRNGEITYKRRG